MDLLFQVIIILGFVKYCCKASFFSDWKGIVAYALFAGLMAVVFYPLIIKMNTNVVSGLLENKMAVSNIAVILTIEAISGMMISIGMLNNLFDLNKRKWVRVLKLTPGVLIFGIVFYIELSVFKTMPGINFIVVALLTSSVLIAAVSALSFIFIKFLPYVTARYELKFIINLLLLILATLLNAGLADYNSSNYDANFEYAKLLAFLGIVISGFAIGFLLFNNKQIIKKTLKLK